MPGHFKDDVLDHLARRANVAQFVSFGPDLVQRHAWIRGLPPGHRFGSLEEAVGGARSPPRRNPRSTSAASSRTARRAAPSSMARPTPRKIAGELRRMAAEGLYTILNETVDVQDGGVSGVAFGDTLEFAPGDTPRCVEKPDAAGFPRDLGLRVLETVYGFRPALPAKTEQRVEFSLHPLRRGYRAEHTILWETEEPGPPPSAPRISWPNRFSRHLGDKAFGLLMADALGLPVPRTRVIPRGLAPFSFGTPTGTAETWLRTCPREQVPGRFTTRHGWTDPLPPAPGRGPRRRPHRLGPRPGRRRGALLRRPGDRVGRRAADRGRGRRRRPASCSAARRRRSCRPRSPARCATSTAAPPAGWGRSASSGRTTAPRPWIVQLHRGASPGAGRVIFPGEPERFHSLETAQGIDALRALIARIEGTGDGVVLVGHVGVTSHFGDLLRRARIPSRIEEPAG